MPELPAPIATYIAAYNAMDVPAMLACLAEDVWFRNYGDGELTVETRGKADFEKLAHAGVAAFRTRHQTVAHAIVVAETAALEIEFAAEVAADLPNGWTAGQRLSFSGASCFRLREGKIAEIVDRS